MKKKLILVQIILLIVSLLTGCFSKVNKENIIEISPFKVENKSLIQLILPNRSLNCLITELTGISEINQEIEIDEVLDLMRKRTLDSDSFVSLELIKFIKTSIVSDTIYIDYSFQDSINLSEVEECLMLYSIVNTVSNYKGIKFVKLSNSNGSKKFLNYFNIEDPLTPTKILLYRDYASPIEAIKKFLNSANIKKETYSILEAQIRNILFDTGTDIMSTNIIDYEYNKYSEYVTVNIKINLRDNSNNSINKEVSFLLELVNGRFIIKEILE